VQTNIDNGNFAKARDEFYERRTRVALRYTIEDVHPAIITPAQKKIKLESA
jgi:hypothetical protein